MIIAETSGSAGQFRSLGRFNELLRCVYIGVRGCLSSQRGASAQSWACAAIVAVVGLSLSMPASAEWEKISDATVDFVGDCPRAFPLRRSDNQPLRVEAGTYHFIEVWGHFIDTADEKDFEFSGGSVEKLSGHGGYENLSRNCGAIGSVRLRLDVDRVDPEQDADPTIDSVLRIGAEEIPIRALLPSTLVKRGPQDGSFRNETRSTNSNGARITGPQRREAVPEPGGDDGNGYITPDINRGLDLTSGVRPPPSTPSTLWQCINHSDFRRNGSDVRQVEGGLLVVLPDNRNSAPELRSCIDRPTWFLLEQQYSERPTVLPDWPSGQVPALRYAIVSGQLRSGFGVLTDEIRLSNREHPRPNWELAGFSLQEDFAMSMVGVRTYRLLATNYRGQTQAFNIRVQSVVPYGVSRIVDSREEQAVLGQRADLSRTREASVRCRPRRVTGGQGGRLDCDRPAAPQVPSVSFRVDLAPSDAALRPLRWEVEREPGTSFIPSSPACFAATSGDITPSAGDTRAWLSIPLAGNCSGQRFILTVGVAGRMDSTLYAIRKPFTID
jgi:hypothetical protein